MHRMPGKRSRGTAHVLRLSGRELVSHPNHESDRKHVRHDPAPTAKDPRLRFSQSLSDDDVQAGSERVQRLEKTPRPHAPQRPHPGSPFHRRRKRKHTRRKEAATILRKQFSQRNRRLNQQLSNPTFDSNSVHWPIEDSESGWRPGGVGGDRLSVSWPPAARSNVLG